MSDKIESMFQREIKRRKFELVSEEHKRWYDYGLYCYKKENLITTGVTSEELFLMGFEYNEGKIPLFTMALLCNAVDKVSFADSKLMDISNYKELILFNGEMKRFYKLMTDPILENIQKIADTYKEAV